MASIYESIDDLFDDMDEQERQEAILGFFKNSFPFLLCPALTVRTNDLPALRWQKVKYTEYRDHAFPAQQGVYIFMVSFEDQNLPLNSYVMYVGKAGDVDSTNTIARRFLDYVNPSGYQSRHRIKRMIRHFREHLDYYYAVVPVGQSTAPIEQALADIFVPPCCQRDFSAEARSLIRGIRI